jgi:hypothetical protein
MATKLIRLDDGLLVEVEVPADQAQQISGGLAERVAASLDKIQPVLRTVATSITDSWRDLSKDVRVNQAELEIGLSFGAYLTVRVVFAPRD